MKVTQGRHKDCSTVNHIMHSIATLFTAFKMAMKQCEAESLNHRIGVAILARTIISSCRPCFCHEDLRTQGVLYHYST